MVTISLVVVLLGGIQLISVGIIGEYLGRVYDEVKQPPPYVVRERPNVGAAAPPPDQPRGGEKQGAGSGGGLI